jgi:phosphate transport system protein
VEQPLRIPFRAELAQVDAEFGKLISDVTQKVAVATDRFLGADADTPVTLVGVDEFTEPIYREVEHRVNVLLARQAPVAGDLRYLLSVLRAVPNLERSAELASEIARRGPQGLAGLISPRARILITRLGDVVTAMWQEVTRDWQGFTPDASTSLESADEEHDDLLAKLVAEIAASDWPSPVTMDMALIARFYERLGDHATEIAKDIDQITGSMPNRDQ